MMTAVCFGSGGVAERPIAPVLKTGDGASRSWVRIPPPPLVFAGKPLAFRVFSVLSAADIPLSAYRLTCPLAATGVSEKRSESAKQDAKTGWPSVPLALACSRPIAARSGNTLRASAGSFHWAERALPPDAQGLETNNATR